MSAEPTTADGPGLGAVGLAAAGVCLTLALWQQARLWPLFAEDAFIVLRYAENLVAGHGLVWNVGEPVEGYSNLLWILGCAGFLWVGVEADVAARLFGGLCMSGAVLVLLRMRRPRRWSDLAVVALGPAVLATHVTTVTWTLGGLEGPMVVLLIVWSTAAMLRLVERGGAVSTASAFVTGIPFALMCLARSEGPLWLVAPTLALWLRGRRHGVSWFLTVVALITPAVIAVLGQLVFRLSYYGEWVPNTAHLKVDLGSATLTEGLAYLDRAWQASRGLLPLALIGAVIGLVRRDTRLRALLFTLPIALWCGYLAAVGGDYFPSHRMFIAVVPLLAFLAVEAVAWIATLSFGAVPALVLAGATVGVLTWDTHHDHESAALRDTGLEWKNVAFGEMMHRAFASQRPLVAVDAAGGIPFGSKLPHVDMLGFNDPVVARTPVRDFAYRAVSEILGRAYMPGHMKGNGRYVLDRRPDVVLFNSAPCAVVPTFVSGYEMQSDPRWLRDYRCVQLRCPPARLPNGLDVRMQVSMWVRLEGRVGVRRDGNVVEVPGLLLGSFDQTVPFRLLHVPPPGTPERVALDVGMRNQLNWSLSTPVLAVIADDRIDCELRAPGAGTCTALQLDAGRWRIEPQPAHDGVVVQLLDDAGQVVGVAGAPFDLVAGGRFDLQTIARDDAALPLRIRSVRLVRDP